MTWRGVNHITSPFINENQTQKDINLIIDNNQTQKNINLIIDNKKAMKINNHSPST